MLKLWRDIGRDTRLVMVSYALWGIGEGLWMFIQPLYVKSLGASPEQAGFVIGLWGWGRLLFILPAGILADRWEFWQGRKSRLHDRIRYRLVAGLWTRERLAP